MPEHATAFAAWEAFYVIVGSSAAALTGLQFVVIVLGSEVNVGGTEATTRAFGTPTIMHFCAVLFVAALISAPWRNVDYASIVLGVAGGVGVLYSLRVVWLTRSQTHYQPVLEDWIWHCAIPVATYATLLAAAIQLPRHPE